MNAFNLALALQQHAQLVCDMSTESRTLSLLQRAMDNISKSSELFDKLKSAALDNNSATVTSHHYDQQMAVQRHKHCEFIRSNVSRRISQQTANEELQRERVMELKRKRDEEALIVRQREVEVQMKFQQEQELLRLNREALHEQLKPVVSSSEEPLNASKEKVAWVKLHNNFVVKEEA